MHLPKALFLFACVVGIEAANICGKVGSHDPKKMSYYMGNFFYKGPNTFALCASYCKQDATKCKSFRYSYWADAAAQYCEFFDSGLEGNFTEDSTQPYWYYDIGCSFPAYAVGPTSIVTVQGSAPATTQIQTQWQTQTITSTFVPPVVTQFLTTTTTNTLPQVTVSITTTSTQTVLDQRTVVQSAVQIQGQGVETTRCQTVTIWSRTLTSTQLSTRMSTATVVRISIITRTTTITSTSTFQAAAAAAAVRTVTSITTRQGMGTTVVRTTTRTVTVRG